MNEFAIGLGDFVEHIGHALDCALNDCESRPPRGMFGPPSSPLIMAPPSNPCAPSRSTTARLDARYVLRRPDDRSSPASMRAAASSRRAPEAAAVVCSQ